MRRQAMGFVGEDPVHTPNIDRLAREGIYLPQATSTYPLCTPWRGMMMTGRYPPATGIVHNANSTRPSVYLRRNEDCITDVLHRAGYNIGYIGKWHLTHPHEPYLPQDQRENDVKWDEFTPKQDRHHIDFWYAYNAYDEHLRPRYWTTDAGRNDFHYVDEWSPAHETDLALRYLENRDGRMRDATKPFALWMSLNPPHSPYAQIPPHLRERYHGRTWRELLNRDNVRLEGTGSAARAAVLDYFAAISGVDEQLGRILELLDRLNLAKDTVVVFTSDHGDMMGSHGLMSKPYAFREAFEIPLIFRWPGHIAPGASDDLLIGTADLMPTVLGLMGLKTAIPTQVEGADYSSVLLGQPFTARPKSSLYMDETNGGHRGIRTNLHTLILSQGRDGEPPVRLFDDKADPFQLHDISAANPKLVTELTMEVQRWLDHIGDRWSPSTPPPASPR
ncbi:MAG: sulfatase [Opitutaceae bacterium]|nr:sulfatase [Opitutaceae bacterium]